MSLFVIFAYTWLGIGLIFGLFVLYVSHISENELEKDLNNIPNNPFVNSNNMILTIFVACVLCGYITAAIFISVGIRRLQERG